MGISRGNSNQNILQHTVADPGGGRGGHAPPGPIKLVIKKMAAEGGRIDFMFLDPPPLPGHWIRYCVTRANETK